MKKRKALVGALLKLERLKQNLSQKAVCFGICVPSYLSKIEYGTVRADEDILSKLFERLGIAYIGESQKLERLKAQIKEYFEKMLYGLDTKSVYQELQKEDAVLSFSCLAIDWLLIKKHQGDEETFQEQLQANMTTCQKAYYVILNWETYLVQKERMEDFEEAAKTIDNSFAMNLLCMFYFQLGEYNKIHQLEQKIVAMALKEGNTYQLADFYFLNGSAYACLNMEEMMADNINRSIHLLQNTGWNDALNDQYYNLGATYISLKKYDLAKKYLEKIETRENQNLFMIPQKLALSYIRSGDLEKGKEYLKQMKEVLPQFPKDERLFSLLFQEAEWECQENFLDEPAYLELLEQLAIQIKKVRPFGFLYFFYDVIVESYTRQRKYKKALEFQREISQRI